MERVVSTDGQEPDWSTIRARIAACGVALQMRMIDNMPAFPDEGPEPNWQELRVSLGHGMITIRREPGRFRVIVWGNADPETVRDQELLVKVISTNE
jgi:hypothetical protein